MHCCEVDRLFHLSCEVTHKSYLIFHGGVNVELLLDLLDGGLLERVGLGHQLSKVVVHRSEHVVADGGQSKIINLLGYYVLIKKLNSNKYIGIKFNNIS